MHFHFADIFQHDLYTGDRAAAVIYIAFPIYLSGVPQFGTT